MTVRNSRASSRGFALILVLWILVLIAAVGTYILAGARTETAIAQNVVAGAQAEALADSGVALAVFNLLDPVESRRWPLDGEPHLLSVPGGSLSVRLIDEGGKINPNLAPESLMAGLFVALGVEPSPARRLGAAVADWIDTDDVPRREGAEVPQYADAGLSYRPFNAPLRNLDELGLVLGVTPEILAAARPYLTLCTEQAAPDPARAPPLVRNALGLAETASAAPSRPSPTRGEEESDARPSAGGDAADASAAPDAVVATVEVIARATRGGEFVRRAIVSIEPGGDGKGYVVLDWGRGATPL
jgi:general secretion pathway protein K